MARKSAERPDTLTVTFKKRQHFWFDAGLLGLYVMAERTGNVSTRNVQITHDASSVCFSGAAAAVRRTLEEAYDFLLDEYYNVSTQKQKEEKAGYYYDSKSKRRGPVRETECPGHRPADFQQSRTPFSGSDPLG
ncbi:MAG: hypothetical protein V1792_03810 [Pseudomonadota bacterium]